MTEVLFMNYNSLINQIKEIVLLMVCCLQSLLYGNNYDDIR